MPVYDAAVENLLKCKICRSYTEVTSLIADTPVVLLENAEAEGSISMVL